MRSTSGWIALAGAASIWLSVGDTALARHGHDDSTESLPSVELPAYGAASNRDIEVTVSNTLYFKDKGYLPKDRNWVQIALRVRNTSERIVSFANVKSRQSSGVVLESASSPTQLAKPPSMTGTAGKTMAIGAGGMMAGMFIFPPLAVVGGIFSVFSGLGGAEKWSSRITRIQESSLHPGEIAPGTAVEGTVYIPATTTQDALIVFYSVDGRTQTLNMPRAATMPQEVR